MTNKPNKETRNLFGTFGAGYGNNGIDYALKPGFIVKARNNYVIEAREVLTVVVL